MDKDGDKKVSFDELMAYGKTQMEDEERNMLDNPRFLEMVVAAARETFNKGDKNGDGYWFWEEVKSI